MSPMYRYPTSVEMMQKTWGGTANEISDKMKQPLRGKPYGVSYRRDPKFFGKSVTARTIRWY